MLVTGRAFFLVEAIMLDLLNRIAQFLVGTALFIYLVVNLARGLYAGFTG